MISSCDMRQCSPKVPCVVEQDDKWVLFDDDDVTFVNWKDMTGLSTDLCGGKADTQIVSWLKPLQSML